jgi:hypothetical protein
MGKRKLSTLRARLRRLEQLEKMLARNAATPVRTPEVRQEAKKSNWGRPWPKWVWETVTADNVSDGYYLRAYEARADLKEHCPGGRIIKQVTTKDAIAAMYQEYEIYAFRSFIEDICGYGNREREALRYGHKL